MFYTHKGRQENVEGPIFLEPKEFNLKIFCLFSCVFISLYVFAHFFR